MVHRSDRDNGRLVCLIGVARLRPAEFVIFWIGPVTSDGSAEQLPNGGDPTTANENDCMRRPTCFVDLGAGMDGRRGRLQEASHIDMEVTVAEYRGAAAEPVRRRPQARLPAPAGTRLGRVWAQAASERCASGSPPLHADRCSSPRSPRLRNQPTPPLPTPSRASTSQRKASWASSGR